MALPERSEIVIIGGGVIGCPVMHDGELLAHPGSGLVLTGRGLEPETRSDLA